MQVACEVCRNTFEAKAADRKRGWARFCGKSCAAVARERGRRAYEPDWQASALENMEAGWDGHKSGGE